MRWVYVLVPILIFSLAGNAFLIWRFTQDAPMEAAPSFELLSPEISQMSVEDFLARQHTYTTTLHPLKPSLQQDIANRSGHYGIYVEDLTTGAWVGVNERDQFMPMSLLKVPVMVAVLKKVQDGDIRLNDTVILLPEDVNVASGVLGQADVGRTIAVRDLLTIMIRDSDNTAARTLLRQVLTDDDYIAALIALGLDPSYKDQTISPKEYSNILRSVYFSSYLRRPFSEMAMETMSHTSYEFWVPAGVPANVTVAHKVGYDAERGIYHDCGIVYIPRKPYLLCIMSTNSTFDEASATMNYVSSGVYRFMSDTAALPSMP